MEQYPASETPPPGQTIIAMLENGREVETYWNGERYWCELGGRQKVKSWRVKPPTTTATPSQKAESINYTAWLAATEAKKQNGR